jgi:hypothetical protein
MFIYLLFYKIIQIKFSITKNFCNKKYIFYNKKNFFQQ